MSLFQFYSYNGSVSLLLWPCAVYVVE